MAKLIPYRIRFDREENIIYAFKFKPSKGSLNAGDYNTEIKIDKKNDSLVVGTYCECADTLFNKNKLCKHKKKAMEVLKKHEIQFRYEESQVRWLWQDRN